MIYGNICNLLVILPALVQLDDAADLPIGQCYDCIGSGGFSPPCPDQPTEANLKPLIKTCDPTWTHCMKMRHLDYSKSTGELVAVLDRYQCGSIEMCNRFAGDPKPYPNDDKTDRKDYDCQVCNNRPLCNDHTSPLKSAPTTTTTSALTTTSVHQDRADSDSTTQRSTASLCYARRFLTNRAVCSIAVLVVLVHIFSPYRST